MSNLIREGQIFIIITISCHELIINIKTWQNDSAVSNTSSWLRIGVILYSTSQGFQNDYSSHCMTQRNLKNLFSSCSHLSYLSSSNDFIHTWGLWFYAETSTQDPKRERTWRCAWMEIRKSRDFDFVTKQTKREQHHFFASSTHFTPTMPSLDKEMWRKMKFQSDLEVISVHCKVTRTIKWEGWGWRYR